MNIFTTSIPLVFYSMLVIMTIANMQSCSYICPKQNKPSAMFEPFMQFNAREDKKNHTYNILGNFFSKEFVSYILNL